MRVRRTIADRSRAVRVVVAGLALLALSACATIPRSGPVVAGRVVEVDPLSGVVQFRGEGPVPGATPVNVVSGFLRAAPGFSDDHELARSFLTSARQLAWRPDAAVSIYPTTLNVLKVKEAGAKPVATATATPTPAGADSGAASADVRDRAEVTWVTVTTPIIAKVDRNGRYQIEPPGTKVTAKFGLVKVGGQWRINTVADGILISAEDFGVTFRPFKVYFGDPTRRYLVPDVHWFPGTQNNLSDNQNDSLPTALVRVLLEGPPKWLEGAVITGAPANTSMAIDAVVVDDEVATVDLTDQVRTADTRQRQLLASQLQATLGQLRINSVNITVRRLAFDVPSRSSGTNDPSQPDGQPVVDPRVDVRPVLIDAKGRLARLDGRTLEVRADVAALGVPGANHPAVANDSSAYAVLNADRSKLLLQLPGAKVVQLVSSANLTAPSFDPQGWVWTAPGTNTGWVYAAAADSGRIKVKAPWLKGADVVSMRVSRDGTRAVIAARVRGAAHLFVTGVVRDVEGRPQSLTWPPTGLFPSLQTVRDVAWLDEDHLVVLGRCTGDTPKCTKDAAEGPWIVQLGGIIDPVGNPVSGAESITAGNGEISVLAGTDKGVQARFGALWDTVAAGRWPAYPG
ncbi:MAG TPA: LpqB family beta-propeller domain-containing protein [Kineosporiaceae bacterium]|nr:LpqB family beta-propeller domain-containing protein [Kineosporiaceae bacterium]